MRFTEQIDSFLKSHAKQCAYCGNPFYFGEDKTIDHIVPKSHGTDEKSSNKVVVCYACNQNKNAISLKQFREQVNKENIKQYLISFGDLQSCDGIYYAKAIKKKFRIKD